ncbi:leukocyte elastase inhibitor-like isoform X1 [Tachysurus ichikawai]
MESVSMANNNFALHLFKKIKEDNKTNNIFYSPLSISSALAMVSLGAAGNTATQMSEVLCFNKAGKPKSAQQTQKFQLPAALQKTLHHPTAKDDIHVSFNKLMSELNKAGTPYTLSLANRLYGEQTYQFVEIKNLLAQGVLDNLTRLVLVNAIYFKCNWEKQFKLQGTKELPFRLNKKATKPVPMMSQKARFPLAFIPEMQCRILEMPYVGQELSMLIMLPIEIEDDTTGLEKLEKHLTYENFMEWTRPDMMDTVEVQVSVPRFKLEQSYDLKKLLISMGMVDAFDLSKCDFSRMSPCDDLVLSKVVHKSFVDVTEEGTEAAAATAAVMMMRCAMLPPERFVADHPFLFFIQHKPTRSILFCGRYNSP